LNSSDFKLSQAFIPIISVVLTNVFTASLNLCLSFILLNEIDLDTFQKFNADHWSTSILPSFVLPTFILYTIYFPIARILHKDTPIQSIPKFIKRLALRMPIIGSFIGCLGWAIGIGLSRFILSSKEVPISESGQSLLLIVSCLVSIYSFALSYFVCEYYFKKYLFPLIFERDEIFIISKFLKDGLVGKFSFYFFSVVVFPLLVIFFTLSSSIGQVSREEDRIYFFLLVLIFIISGVIITYYLVQSLRKPLNEIQSLTETVRKGDFTGTIFVDSKDELGTIKYTLNTMSRELLEKETIREIFGKMVDGRIRDYLLKHPPELGGKKENVAILFSDIRNFTSFSEKLPPEEVVHFLNDYFEKMNSCIVNNNGIINKFIGDGILAIFGGIIPLENASDSAYNAARQMLDEIRSIPFLNGDLTIGIGLHYGEVTLGNIGSKSRMEFTIIGNSVNLSSRLESFTKELKMPIAMSKDFYNQLNAENQISVHRQGEFNLKGMADKIEVFSTL